MLEVVSQFSASLNFNSRTCCFYPTAVLRCDRINELQTLQCLHSFVSAGDCLLDQPQRQLSLPDNLPGSSYSLHRQCELAFGPGSKPCPYMQPCSKLWCTGKARGQLVCQTRHFPWADGTNCSTGKVCYQGVCSDKNSTFHVKVGEMAPSCPCSSALLTNVSLGLFSFVPGGGALGEMEFIWRLFTKLWWRSSAVQAGLRQPHPREWRQILPWPPCKISLLQPQPLSWHRYTMWCDYITKKKKSKFYDQKWSFGIWSCQMLCFKKITHAHI